MWNRELCSAIAASVVSVLAIYTCSISSDAVANWIISLVAMFATTVPVFCWFQWWNEKRDQERRDLQEQINELRMDLIRRPGGRFERKIDNVVSLERIWHGR